MLGDTVEPLPTESCCRSYDQWLDEQTSDRKTLMKQVEKAKARLAEIDIIISNIYEGKALGRITEHRCLAMTEKYDTESKKTAKRD